MAKNYMFDNFNGEGILLLNGTHDSALEGCTLSNIAKPAIWSNSQSIHNFRIAGNVFRTVGNTGGSMFSINGTSGISQNIVIRDNTIDGISSTITNTFADVKLLYMQSISHILRSVKI